MKGKSLIAGCVIVGLAIVCIATYVYGNKGLAGVDRYGFLRPHAQSLVVQFGTHLVWIDKQGRERQALDLKQLVPSPWGDFAFFSDDTLLLYSQHHEQLAEGFYRCDLAAQQCQDFAGNVAAPRGAFRLAIDQHTDTVYVADTRPSKLYAFNQAGELLAEADGGHLEYPNQLAWLNEQLWVANTDGHQLAQVSTGITDFGEIMETVKVDFDRTYRWPHQLAWSGDGWWVNSGNKSLKKSRIVNIDADGEVIAEIADPQLREPFALAWWQDALWVADLAEPVLHRRSASGEVLAGALAPTLEALSSRSREQANHYRWITYASMAGFVLVLIGGVVAAWTLEKRETLATFKNLTSHPLEAAVARSGKSLPGGEIFWLTHKLRQKRPWLVLLLATMLGLALAIQIMAWQLFEEASPALTLTSFLTAGIILMVPLLFWLLHDSMQTELGVIGSSIVLQKGLSRRTIARGEKLTYSSTHLMADDIIVCLGNPQQRFFDRRQLEDYVFPRLKQARRQNQLQMLKHLWRARDPQLIVSLTVLILVSAMFLAARSIT